MSQTDPTVPTFNPCTKCVGSPGIINGRTPHCHPVSWAWMNFDDLTDKLSFDSQATWVIVMLGLSFDILSMSVFYNQALADVRSSGADII